MWTASRDRLAFSNKAGPSGRWGESTSPANHHKQTFLAILRDAPGGHLHTRGRLHNNETKR